MNLKIVYIERTKKILIFELRILENIRQRILLIVETKLKYLNNKTFRH
jgi:hypothetical protein